MYINIDKQNRELERKYWQDNIDKKTNIEETKVQGKKAM